MRRSPACQDRSRVFVFTLLLPGSTFLLQDDAGTLNYRLGLYFIISSSSAEVSLDLLHHLMATGESEELDRRQLILALFSLPKPIMTTFRLPLPHAMNVWRTQSIMPHSTENSMCCCCVSLNLFLFLSSLHHSVPSLPLLISFHQCFFPISSSSQPSLLFQSTAFSPLPTHSLHIHHPQPSLSLRKISPLSLNHLPQTILQPTDHTLKSSTRSTTSQPSPLASPSTKMIASSSISHAQPQATMLRWV